MADELTKESVDNRKEILDLLKDLQSYYGTYHNHKETMGWAGVLLFSGWMVGFATVFREQLSQSGLSCGSRVTLSLSVIVAYVVFLLYVQKQFALRKHGADLVAACVRLRSEFVSEPSKLVNTAEWAPPAKVVRGATQSTCVLPRAVLELAEELSTASQTSRIHLEMCAYAILFGVSAALVVKIWTMG